MRAPRSRTASRAAARAGRRAQALANHIARSLGSKRPPLVKLKTCRTCEPGGWKGRYHPNSKIITQEEHPDMPARLRPVLTDHETGHWATREIHCKPKRKGTLLPKLSKRRKCSYYGQHDKRFFATVREIHKRNGIAPKDAIELEEESGYTPPASWKRAAARGHW